MEFFFIKNSFPFPFLLSACLTSPIVSWTNLYSIRTGLKLKERSKKTVYSFLEQWTDDFTGVAGTSMNRNINEQLPTRVQVTKNHLHYQRLHNLKSASLKSLFFLCSRQLLMASVTWGETSCGLCKVYEHFEIFESSFSFHRLYYKVIRITM